MLRVPDLLGSHRVARGKGETGMVEWRPGEPMSHSGWTLRGCPFAVTQKGLVKLVLVLTDILLTNLYDAQEWFHGRQIFHGLEWGDGFGMI